MKRRLVCGVALFHTFTIVFNILLSRGQLCSHVIFCAQFVETPQVTQPLETSLCVYQRMKITTTKNQIGSQYYYESCFHLVSS